MEEISEVVLSVVNFEDGIIFKVRNIEFQFYYFLKYPLNIHDKVTVTGELKTKIICGKETQIFDCESIAAQFQLDLKIFLGNYFSKEPEQNIDVYTDKICLYSEINNYTVPDMLSEISSNCVKHYEKQQEKIQNFADFVFDHLDSNKALTKMKDFLFTFYLQCCIRPLELLGIPKEIIEKLRIPPSQAYKICLDNPLRIPEIPSNIADRIFMSHLRKEPTREQIVCGKINRVVLDKLERRLCTSVPISELQKQFASFDSLLELLCKEYFCFQDLDSMYLSYPLRVENAIVKKISSLIQEPCDEEFPCIFLNQNPNEDQENAIIKACNSKISIINGRGGTGKTRVLTNIVYNCLRQKMEPLCLSFTGKAVTRIKQMFDEQQFTERCETVTIDMAIVRDFSFRIAIIDEISMVTSELFYRFFEKYKNRKWSLVLIGDINQLTPIGWGKFFFQLLKTGIPTYTLTQNYRSEKTILQICNSLIDPERYKNRENVLWNVPGPDYRFHIGNYNIIEDILLRFKKQFISESDFIEKRKTITIVTPYRKNVQELNILYQSIFMFGEFKIMDNRKWFVGDRIMLLNNNYDLNVMNGEEGEVIEIHNDYIICEFRNDSNTRCPFISKAIIQKIKKLRDKKLDSPDILSLYEKLICDFPFLDKNFDMNRNFCILEETNLIHSYALTVHKSQGSEYENAIFYLPNKKSSFININLIYTGISRAKKHLDIVVENVEVLNYCSLRKNPVTWENLGQKINLQNYPSLVDSFIEENDEIQYGDFDEIEFNPDYF